MGRSVSFDWVIVVLGGWLLGGLYVDGWAHHHLATTLESFFTPWHAAFYAGFMAVAGVTAGVLLANRARGAPWARAAARPWPVGGGRGALRGQRSGGPVLAPAVRHRGADGSPAEPHPYRADAGGRPPRERAVAGGVAAD
jgi:hypothetical protein